MKSTIKVTEVIEQQQLQSGREEKKTMGAWAEELAPGLTAKNEKLIGEGLSTAQKAAETKRLLLEAIADIGTAHENFKDATTKILNEIRGFRMATVAEVATVVKPMEDLRKFFLGPDYSNEIARLKEFVELCERLKKLKDEGFLDDVADTLLKLS